MNSARGSASNDPPGFKRVDVLGKRICYLTIPDPEKKEQTHRALYSITEVKVYLKNIGYDEAAVANQLKQFDFGKRKLPERRNDDESKRSKVFFTAY